MFLQSFRDNKKLEQTLRKKADAENSVPKKTPPQKIQKQKKEKKPKKQKAKHRGLSLISESERIFFIDNLATLLQAGMPLSLALGTLANEAKSRSMRKALKDIKVTIDNGGQLSEALRAHPDVFSTLYIAVVEVGEAGGTLADVLTRLAETSKKAKKLKSKIVGAMIYPIVVVIAMIVVVIVLMIYVFPQLIAIFEEVEVELPIQTKILITVVDFLQIYGLYVLGGLFISVLLFILLGRIRSIKRVYHVVFMHLPFAGAIWKEVVLVRVVGNLKMLLSSGVPIVQAINITSRTAGNYVFEDELVSMSKELELGQSIHETIGKRDKIFPSLMASMARVGEETGKFDEILGKLEEYYEGRVQNVFANLSTTIEPVLLLSIGTMVGFIAVSVIMPIYDLAQSF